MSPLVMTRDERRGMTNKDICLGIRPFINRMTILVKAERTVHNDPGGISSACPGRHCVVRGSQAGFVAERPGDDAGVVLVPFDHTLRPAPDVRKERPIGANRGKTEQITKDGVYRR